MLAMKRAPADHDTQKGVGPTLDYVLVLHFLCVVNCDSTRPRGCLFSAHLSHIWSSTPEKNWDWLVKF